MERGGEMFRNIRPGKIWKRSREENKKIRPQLQDDLIKKRIPKPKEKDHGRSLSEAGSCSGHLPNGFPSTENGVEIKLLKKIFKPEQAALFCDLRLTFETAWTDKGGGLLEI